MSQFRFEEFNPRRHMRGAEAARVTWINDQGEEDTLWMSPADICGNVLLHGPHYGLLVAASQYHMKADQLVALHRSKGKNKAFLQPVEPTRDHLGYWTHPDYPSTDAGPTEESFSEWLRLVGHASTMVWLDSDLGARTVAHSYLHGDGDISSWVPRSPAVGEGWFIGSIRDTEDGPVCVWLHKEEV